MLREEKRSNSEKIINETKKNARSIFGKHLPPATTYAIDLGTHFVGMVVIICCHTRVPTPRKMHQTHCSTLRGVVEKATPPNCTMTIWKVPKMLAKYCCTVQ